MSNIEIIRSVYAAFESGDITTVFDLCDPEVVVTQDPALPWGGRYEGIDGVATFGIALGGTTRSEVTVEALFEADDGVVQYGRTKGTVIANGNEFDVPETHVWTLRDGKIVAADFYIDSAAMLIALGPES